MSDALIDALHDPACYPHPVGEITLHETHISWVLLTGDYAYKIKKPRDFGFLDFSTLARRRHFCHEELRLNRRLAPALYLAVVPITGDVTAPRLGGAGEPFEYAVRMRQFDTGQMLDRLQAQGRLEPSDLDALADRLAAFHATLPATDDARLGTPARVRADAEANVTLIRPRLTTPAEQDTLTELAAWSEAALARLTPHLIRRHRQGWVRECHGDLHLANMVRYQGAVTVFDGIEFSDGLRWIDTVNDLAFLLMDLEQRGAWAGASRLLNRYLQQCGDVDGLALLTFYKVYRALVRAKIALLTRDDPALDEAARIEQQARCAAYLALAQGYTRPRPRCLLVTTGLSGSGKSWLSERLAEALGLVWLRSDVERKRLFGLAPQARSEEHPALALYTPAATRATYQRLAELARTALIAGYPVIVDAAALKRHERETLRAVAADQGVPSLLLACRAPEPLLSRRLRARAAAGTDPSEADVAVMRRQRAGVEPLSAAERAASLSVEGAELTDVEALAAQLRERLGLPEARA